MALQYTLSNINNKKYTLSDVFKYESITCRYCVLKGNTNLSIPELIYLASLEDEFDIDYAFYLRYKQIHQIKEFISGRDKCLGNSLPFISDDILYEEELYEEQINQYKFTQPPTTFDLLNAALNDKKWDLVFFIYIKECNEIYNLIVKTEDEFNEKKELKNRKFFIVQ